MDAEALEQWKKWFRQATASAAIEGITQPEELKDLDELLYRGKINTEEYRNRGLEILALDIQPEK
ncbi:MAG: hypothetical protein KKG88_10910 [Proteobacteria bacterium]|nr:hypothetical protein [Pseudomonadota bacterium]